MAVYAIESLTACEIQLLPFAYVLNMVLLFVLFRRTNLYDLSINAEHIREERREYGYVSFSRHGKYIGSNDVARKYFPDSIAKLNSSLLLFKPEVTSAKP